MKRKFKRRLKNHGARLLPVKTPAIPAASAPAPAAKSQEAQIADVILGIEDPAKRRRAMKHFPIEIMIAKGKDELEAALFFVIDELVADARHKWERVETIEARGQGSNRRNSLGAVFSSVVNLFNHADDERAFFYEPHLATMASRRRELLRECVGAHSKIWTALGRRRRFIHRFDTATDELDRLNRDLALVTGFALGIQVAQEALLDNQKKTKQDQFERFSIAFPAEPKVETKARASGE